MEINDILQLYARQPQVGALVKSLKEKPQPTVFLQGLLASATPMVFAAVAGRARRNMVFILQDADEAGYFYNDLQNIFAHAEDKTSSPDAPQVLFFPSSYKRAIKYGQRDAANEILRTEVLAALSAENGQQNFIVTHPEALAELVVSQHHLSSRRISLRTSQRMGITDLVHQLRDLGFTEEDYVYEPGQFANRGSIVDVYSFSSDLPFRIDFFGDEVDTIRTFTVEDQLSKDKKTEVEIVPELASVDTEKVPILEFLPADTLLVMKDLSYITGTVERIYNEGFSDQALTERLEGATEMEQERIRQQMTKESALCAPTRFTDDIARFQHVFFGPETNKVQSSKVKGQRGKREPELGYRRLFINLGKTDGFYPGEIMQFINRHVRGRQEVGHIDLLQKFCYIEVPEEDAVKVMRALNGQAYKGREVRCNDADEAGHGRGARNAEDEKPFSPALSRKGRGSKVTSKNDRGGRSASRGAARPQHHGRDDWKELISGKPFKLRGEEPDFSEEGWARRRPKKNK